MQKLKDQDAQHLPGGKFNGWEKIVIAIVCKGKSRYETTEVFEKNMKKTYCALQMGRFTYLILVHGA